ncbi:MAG TPA: hypothetical protein PKK26_00670 [Candidatus Wallbacteria bacterium]|nr:hypothetical protein [Candidatus Wallbacteria bacterium]
MKNGLIIEGISGAGKSKVISEIKKLMAGRTSKKLEVIYEARTYGELMDELKDASRTDRERCERLENVCDLIACETGKFFIVERFHPSYYAIMPDRSLYEKIDRKMGAMGFKLVLLSYRDENLRERAMNHTDGGPKLPQKIEEYFGSAEAAMNKYTDSKARREEYLKFTSMDHMVIMTDEMNWTEYAIRALEFAGIEIDRHAVAKSASN